MDIDQHYSDHMEETGLLAQLRQRYPEGPTLYQLAPIDQLHIGGIKASEKLLQQLDLIQPKRILEIGSGAGGLMRMISNRCSAEIVGIDITHRFNALNSALTQLTKLPASLIITGDAQQLPFASNSFDCIIFQHSLLNIPHTDRCLQECLRVLDNEGSLLLHEVLEGANPERMHYPVPWARSAAQSHILTFAQLTDVLQQNGFELNTAENWSEAALQWRQRQASKEHSGKNTVSVSPLQIFGDSFRQMGVNVIANLNEGAVEVWQLSCIAKA